VNEKRIHSPETREMMKRDDRALLNQKPAVSATGLGNALKTAYVPYGEAKTRETGSDY